MMFFRQYNSMLNEANKGFAKGMFILGLFLIGFAMLVWVLKEVFAFIAAGIFIIAGVGCLSAAVKAWLYNRRFKSSISQNEDGLRKNVRIRYDETEL